MIHLHATCSGAGTWRSRRQTIFHMLSSMIRQWNHLLVKASITKDLPSINFAISVHTSSSNLFERITERFIDKDKINLRKKNEILSTTFYAIATRILKRGVRKKQTKMYHHKYVISISGGFYFNVTIKIKLEVEICREDYFVFPVSIRWKWKFHLKQKCSNKRTNCSVSAQLGPLQKLVGENSNLVRYPNEIKH